MSDDPIDVESVDPSIHPTIHALVVGAVNPVGEEVARLLAKHEDYQVDLADVHEVKKDLEALGEKLFNEFGRSPLKPFNTYPLTLAGLPTLAKEIEPLEKIPYTRVVFVTRQPRQADADPNNGLHHQFLGEILGPYLMATRLRDAYRYQSGLPPLTITFVYTRSHNSDLKFINEKVMFPMDSNGFRTQFDNESVVLRDDTKEKYPLKVALIAAANAVHNNVIAAVAICPIVESSKTRPGKVEMATRVMREAIGPSSSPMAVRMQWINGTKSESSELPGSHAFGRWLDSLLLQAQVECSESADEDGGFVLSSRNGQLLQLLKNALPLLAIPQQQESVQQHLKLLQDRHRN